MAEADYFGVESGNRVTDKFARSGLTASKAETVDAPVINEFPHLSGMSVHRVSGRGIWLLQGHGTRGRGFQGRPEAEKVNIHLKRQSRPENGWLCLFLFRIEVRPVRRYRFRSNRASSTPPSRMAKSARFQT